MGNTTAPSTPRPLAFVDTETTGLDPDEHRVWEIAVIMRHPGRPDWEHHWQIRQTAIHLAYADQKALEIGRYHERMIVPEGGSYAQLDQQGQPTLLGRDELVDTLTNLLRGATLVGSNPGFDANFLRYFLDASPWHYRPVDIATMAVGHLYGQAYTLTKQQCDAEFYQRADALLADGWKSYELSRLMGIEPPSDADAHTALGDARWARDVFDAITKADAFYAATDAELSSLAAQALSTRGGGK